MSAMKIEGSICFVTGTNRGIGKAYVEELINAGASKVYAAARKLASLSDLVANYPDKIVPIELDVTNEDQIKAAASQAGDTQILINNAGTAGYTAIIATPDITSARYEMEVNYFGLLNMTRAFAPILTNNGGGVLVNLSSIGGLVGIPMVGTYSATKAAVHSLSQSVRGELAAQNTLVICVYPGPIETEMAAGIEMEKETPTNVAKETLAAIESGAEEVFPDKVAKETAAGMQQDAKAVEKQWAEMLPQPA